MRNRVPTMDVIPAARVQRVGIEESGAHSGYESRSTHAWVSVEVDIR